MQKLKVYHFHNGAGGGVWSVIKNLAAYSANPLIENHVIHTINRDLQTKFELQSPAGIISEQVFYYSSCWNFKYTCKQLSKLLPNAQAFVVAHDWLELGMMSNLGLKNPALQFVHGDYAYYYELSKLHAEAVDQFVAVAENIEKRLLQLLPQRASDIGYFRFPVPSVTARRGPPGKIKIVFIGRREHAKGYHLLPPIAERLHPFFPSIQWHIIGDAPAGEVQPQWSDGIDVRVHGNLANEQVLAILQDMDFFILPSLAEGMPVSLIEAMKSGLVPIVNDLPGGVQELVINGETGYRIARNNLDGYVESISELINDREKHLRLRTRAMALANKLFDPFQNTAAIEALYLEVAARESKAALIKKVYGSRLDKDWIPNWVTTAVRRLGH